MHRIAYFAPTEFVPNLSSVKRAIMTYDRVLLPAPSDREYFPPQAFMMAIGMPPIIGLPVSSVRPLGKYKNYDDEYQHLLDQLQPAIKDGVLEIVSTFRSESSKNFTIGKVDMGGFPVDPKALLWIYRTAAREQSYLAASIKNDQRLLSLEEDELSAIAIDTASADGGINQDPRLPDIEGDFADEHKRTALSQIARARLATAIKAVAYCSAKEMIPLFSEPTYGMVVTEMGKRAADFVDLAAKHDPYWVRRNQVLDLAYSEYLDEDKLQSLSTRDCLKFRSKSWGQQAEKRDELLNSASELAKQRNDQPEFEAKVREEIHNFRRYIESVKQEREGLKYNVVLDLTEVGSKAALYGVAAHEAGTMAQLQTGIGSLTFLLTACYLAAPKIKNWKNELQGLRKSEQIFRDSACLGVHNFFR